MWPDLPHGHRSRLSPGSTRILPSSSPTSPPLSAQAGAAVPQHRASARQTSTPAVHGSSTRRWARGTARARARARWPRDPSPGRCLWRPPLPLLRSGGTLGAPIRRVRCLRTRSARVETPEPRLRRISPQFSPGPLSGDAALEPGPAPTTLLRARSSARRSPSFLLPGKSFLSPSFVFGHRRDHDSVRLWRRSRANPFLWARACALVTPLAQLGQSDPRAASALVSVPPLDSINNNVLNHYT